MEQVDHIVGESTGTSRPNGWQINQLSQTIEKVLYSALWDFLRSRFSVVSLKRSSQIDFTALVVALKDYTILDNCSGILAAIFKTRTGQTLS